MIMKALSLWQPWASLVALGAKKYETRSWSTAYRGPLLICSAKKWNRGLAALAVSEPFITALGEDRIQQGLPLGQALCVASLTWIYEIHAQKLRSGLTDYVLPNETERAFGDYRPGRFAWRLMNIRAFKPFPIIGRQGFFNVDIDPKLLKVPA